MVLRDIINETYSLARSKCNKAHLNQEVFEGKKLIYKSIDPYEKTGSHEGYIELLWRTCYNLQAFCGVNDIVSKYEALNGTPSFATVDSMVEKLARACIEKAGDKNYSAAVALGPMIYMSAQEAARDMNATSDYFNRAYRMYENPTAMYFLSKSSNDKEIGYKRLLKTNDFMVFMECFKEAVRNNCLHNGVVDENAVFGFIQDSLAITQNTIQSLNLLFPPSFKEFDSEDFSTMTSERFLSLLEDINDACCTISTFTSTPLKQVWQELGMATGLSNEFVPGFIFPDDAISVLENNDRISL